MAARGWFRRPKGKLVYVWQVKDPTTGNAKERAKVIGDATLSDEKGWQIVGKLKDQGVIKTDHEPSPDRFFCEIAFYYLANKEWKKESRKVLHTQIVNKILVPRWGDQVAVKIKPGEVIRLRVVPRKAGRFVFRCDIFCGKGHEDMTGEFVVE